MEDNNLDYEKESAMAKMDASDVAMRAAIECVQIFGGYGYCKEYPAERHMRDAKICQIYEGTNEIQRVVIARKLLGMR
ncbi:MAG: acyl-CoA dehydrogenase family protein, partial [Syntrophales bacterium]|nr:acyl-CoA dehydrogenase family protein [Syntrophales bacterium]